VMLANARRSSMELTIAKLIFPLAQLKHEIIEIVRAGRARRTQI
jgi:hypothetical protein